MKMKQTIQALSFGAMLGLAAIAERQNREVVVAVRARAEVEPGMLGDRLGVVVEAYRSNMQAGHTPVWAMRRSENEFPDC